MVSPIGKHLYLTNTNMNFDDTIGLSIKLLMLDPSCAESHQRAYGWVSVLVAVLFHWYLRLSYEYCLNLSG